MAQQIKILIIGIDPALVDFKTTQFYGAPDLDPEKVAAAYKETIQALTNLGLEIDKCNIVQLDTALAILEQKLTQKQYNIILIGAGIRVPFGHFLIFEQFINCIHSLAPASKICFNTNPYDTTAVIQRWL